MKREITRYFRQWALLIYFVFNIFSSVCCQNINDTVKFDIYFEDPSKPSIVFITLPGTMDYISYDLYLPFLKDLQQNLIIETISVNPGRITLAPNSARNISLSFKSLPRSGLYSGNLVARFSKDSKKDSLEIPIRMIAHSPNDLKFVEVNPKVTINFVRGLKGINNILPKVYNQHQASVLALKSGYNSVKDIKYSQYVNGSATKTVVPDSQLSVTYNFKANGLPFDILIDINNLSVKADQYTGKIYFQDHPNHPYDEIDLTINVRNGVAGAIFVLFFGALFGWMARKVELSAVKVQLYQSIIRLKLLIINEFKIKEEVPDILRNLDVLSREISFDLREIEDLRTEFEKLKKQTIYAIKSKEIADEFSDLPHIGTLEQVSRLKEILTLLRGLWSNEKYTEFDVLKNEFHEIIYGITNKKEKNVLYMQNLYSVEQLMNQEIDEVKWYESILQKFTGMPAIVGIYRPIVWIVTMVLSLLAIFYESYVINGENFGSGGIFDYIKLFIYGTGIVVTIDQVIKNFLPGIQAKINTKPVVS